MKYVKMTGQFVCKMAIPLALMFAACSDNGNSIVKGDDHSITPLGGSAEETGIVASLAITGRASRIASLGDSADPNTWKSAAERGAVIRLSELDSVTLDTTGKFFFTVCNDSAGEFRFDSVSLTSPYVMLELAPYVENEFWSWDGNWNFQSYDPEFEIYWPTYSVFVDLRKARNVDINIVTYLETFRIRNLFAQGMDFAMAKKQADGEMLEALGFYGKSFDFDKADYVRDQDKLIALAYLNDFLYDWNCFKSPEEVANVFGSTGTLVADSSIRKFFVDEIFSAYNNHRVTDESKSFLNGFMASLFGVGECSAERDGFSTVLTFDEYRSISFACREESWSFSVDYVIPEAVQATLGIMADERDGKSYKTVSYNINGETQTWLAENLKYKSVDGSYTFPETMDLPDSVALETYEECLEWRSYQSCDERQVKKNEISYERLWAAIDSVETVTGVYQGVCPAGWHIPTAAEWEKFLRHVYGKQGSVTGEFVDEMALVGFGEVGIRNSIPYVVKSDTSYVSEFGRGIGRGDVVILIRGRGMKIEKYNPFGDLRNSGLDDGRTAIKLFVRCVKN